MLEQASTYRLTIFSGLLVIMILWELISPRRVNRVSKGKRWFNNFGLSFLNTAIIRIIFVVSLIEFAGIVQNHQWGLLNLFEISGTIKIALAILLFDCIIYFQHWAFHVIPIFWRLHKVHHTDLDFDVSTGIRFHPIEIILSMLIKFAVVMAFGIPPESVLIFEAILSSTALFNHGNVFIPTKIDGWLRWLIVTPDMHRIHHSTIQTETDSNFGFNVPWWDRIFGTYTASPQKDYPIMAIGLDDYQNENKLSLLHLLMIPFQSNPKTQETPPISNSSN